MMDLILSWLCSAIAQGLQEIVDMFTGLFGYDISKFNDTFTFAAVAYDIIRQVALAIAILLIGWQIICFFTKSTDKLTSTPIRTALNAIISIGFIYYGNYLFELILDFCQYPYDTLEGMNAVEWGVNGGLGNFLKNCVAETFAGYSMLIYLIMLIMIGFNFIKLLLEIVERYVVTFVLMYLSPLASATLASNSTNGIYKKFFTMFISQCLLLFLNVWCLKMALSGLSLSSSSSPTIVSLLLCFAFLRVSAKMDSYINQLGLNAAVTGEGLGAEIFATGHAMLKAGGGGGGGKGGSGGGNAILGAAKVTQQWAQRYNPAAAAVTSLKDSAVGAAKGFSEAYRSGASVTESVRSGANLKDGIAKGATTFKDNMAKGVSEIGPAAKEGFRTSDNLVTKYFEKDLLVNKGMGANGYQTKMVGRFTSENETTTDSDVAAVATHSHLAQNTFTKFRTTGASSDGDSRDVSAIMKGLGADKVNQDVSGFVDVGFNNNPAANNIDYKIDAKGIHAQYEADGYAHAMSLKDHTQFSQMSETEKHGYEKFSTPDGHRYYIKTSKSKIDAPSKDKDSKEAEAKPTESTPTESKSAK